MDFTGLTDYYPGPWSVKYDRRFTEWNERSSPYIIDANGNTVIQCLQHVNHPGDYDCIADQFAHFVVDAFNLRK